MFPRFLSSQQSGTEWGGGARLVAGGKEALLVPLLEAEVGQVRLVQSHDGAHVVVPLRHEVLKILLCVAVRNENKWHSTGHP